MKPAIAIIAAVLVIGGIYLFYPGAATETFQEASEQTVREGSTQVSEGTYEVVPAESKVNWAGKKPLLEGYVNSGSIAVASGTIVVANGEASGEFAIDMDTLSVSSTPTKPGQESSLEGHLKGERWFNVAAYPTTSFKITSVEKQADSDTTFVYDVTGDLTLKGETHEISFPALIYQDAEGALHAEASFEINRTTWGITSGSASFFDDVADNAIDDMVALSFALTAKKAN